MLYQQSAAETDVSTAFLTSVAGSAEPRAWHARTHAPAEAALSVVKRAIDILVSVACLVFFGPLLLLIALAVRLDSPGPSLFRQARGGLWGREFDIYKFRTMRVTENGRRVVQAIANDERVTKLGSFLRRSSLDELPQLLNVLRGEMSLVGPRPHAIAHDRQFAEIDPSYVLRAAVRPGLTGLAQVSGSRGPTPTKESVRARIGYDLEYVHNWSLILDVVIIVRTIRSLRRGEG